MMKGKQSALTYLKRNVFGVHDFFGIWLQLDIIYLNEQDIIYLVFSPSRLDDIYRA